MSDELRREAMRNAQYLVDFGRDLDDKKALMAARSALDRFEHDAPVRQNPPAPRAPYGNASIIPPPPASYYGQIVWSNIPVGTQPPAARILLRIPRPWTWPWIQREINHTLCRWFGHAPWEVERCGCGEDGEEGMGRRCPRCGEWE